MNTTRMLVAEELALLVLTTRSSLWRRANGYALNACLAALLVAELGLPDRPSDSVALRAAQSVVAEKGPSVEAVLSHMDRGLRRRTGRGTWGVVTASLSSPPATAGDELIARLRAAGASDDRLDQRTALLAAFVDPAKLLRAVAPRRSQRRAVRRRFAAALDGSGREPLVVAVRRLIARQEVAVVTG